MELDNEDQVLDGTPTAGQTASSPKVAPRVFGDGPRRGRGQRKGKVVARSDEELHTKAALAHITTVPLIIEQIHPRGKLQQDTKVEEMHPNGNLHRGDHIDKLRDWSQITTKAKD